MTAQDQPRGSREAYERLSDPAMYWTQVNAQPIREPIRRDQPRDEEETAQYHELPENHPYRELSPSWRAEDEQEETALAEILPYQDEQEAAYDDRRDHPGDGYPRDEYSGDDYRTDDYRNRRSVEDADLEAQERFGGVNWGAGFFGWLVAVGFAVFLTAGLLVVLAVLRRTVPAVSSMAETRPGATAIALAAGSVAVLMVAYYAGGYVAGRMSRFDGGRQGAGVWVTGLLLTALAIGAGLFLGTELDLFALVDPPSLPVPDGSTGLAGLVGAAAAMVGSLLAAIGGGKVGCRYHRKIDEYL
jgi:hypothetical protein